MTHQERFVSIYQEKIQRRGAEKLLEWLQSDSSDFFTAPSSTRFHGAYEGGLVEHSLNVYDCLCDYLARPRTKELYGMDYTEETIAITALLHDLCKVNFYTVDYRNAKNPVADLNIKPESFVGATSMGMYVVLNEEKEKNLRILHSQVENLRKNRILPAGNRANVNAGIFESETGEICANVRKHTLTIDTPKFQSVVLKKSEPVALKELKSEAKRS